MDQKIARIQALKDEVNELHPLLQKLFPLLPNVIRVEYTHGSNEKGADFVIARSDEVAGGEEYIGVIVKAGDIRQNFDDVERQIKECSLPRTFDGGKKKIILCEIWVVASGGITNNAQEKINDQFADKKIKLIWDERLAQLVDKYVPIFWANVEANLGYYLGAVSRQVDDLIHRTGFLDVALADFYVEQDLRRVELDPKKQFSFKSKNRLEQLSEIVNKERFVLVEAAMGFGKSRLLRQCAKELSNKDKFADTRTLPIFLSFRDLLSQYDGALQGVLDDLQSTHKVDWSKYSILLLIDGVDEMKSELADKASSICAFVRQAGEIQNVKVVFATRPFDDPSVEQELDRHLTRYALQPLTIQRIVKFVERICTNVNITNKLRSDLQKSDLFKSLPRSPISAILLGRVLSTDTKELPSSLPELYSKYLELAIGRWDIHKGDGSEKEYETATILLRLLAKHMLDADAPEMSIKEAEQLIDDYLRKRETGQNATIILGKLLLKTEVNVRDDVRGVLFFRHRSFLEYIYADALYIEYGKTAVLPSPFEPYWGAVIYFYLGRLKDCPEQLESLFSLIPPNISAQLLRLVNAGNYLLSSYHSPYREISACVKSIVLETAQSYCEICDNPTATVLGKFSEIQLLAIFTGLVRNAFEYEFFKRALVDLETDLLLSLDSEKRNVIAAFFVASVRAGLGCKDAFVELIDDHYASLTLPIRLGVTHAACDADFINDAVKRLNKKILRSRRGNRGIDQSTKILYEVPLDERKQH